MTGTVDRALVIGSSIAGLLAAQALSEAYDEVVVLDRDELPYGPVARRGVPQVRHAHGLLAGGREAMEELLPGLTADLAAAGGMVGDAQEALHYYVGPRRYATGRSGLTRGRRQPRAPGVDPPAARRRDHRHRVRRPQLGPRPHVQCGRPAGHRRARRQRRPAREPAAVRRGCRRRRLRTHLPRSGMAGAPGVPAARGRARPLRHQLRHPSVSAAGRRCRDRVGSPAAG